MKKIILLSLTIYYLSSAGFAYAATATPSSQKARELLDRVATKVAQIAQKLNQGFAGTIESIATKSLIVDGKKVNLSEATNYYKYVKGVRSTIELKSLQKNNDVTVIGNVDPTTNDIMATTVISKVIRLGIVGTVSEIDKKTGIYSLNEGQKIKIDITALVKKTATSAAEITKSKTTNITVGNQIAVIGYQETSTSLITALKAIIF